ncbi:MAG: hypothetical protein ACT4P4_23180 [Betaproteobacteria bacterium]
MSLNRRVEYLLLVLLAGLWGSSHLALKIAVAGLPPLTTIAARVGIAAFLLTAPRGERSSSSRSSTPPRRGRFSRGRRSASTPGSPACSSRGRCVRQPTRCWRPSTSA